MTTVPAWGPWAGLFYPTKPRHLRIIILLTMIMMAMCMTEVESRAVLDPRKVDGKTLFQSLTASRCNVSCHNTRVRPVCGTNDITYASRCELKRAKKCEGLRIKVKDKGACPGDVSPRSQCVNERQEAMEMMRRKGSEVLVPSCKPDGSYNEVQCHNSTRYCWCVTRDGRHIPGTSVKNKRPRCKGRRGRRRKGKGGKSKKRKTCSSKNRQAFNTALIKVFEEEYHRVHPSPPPKGAENAAEFGTEKAIVLWKFTELDINKDGTLKFKELRNFGRIVKKLIKPRACAKRFVRYCDKKKDRKIEKAEWTLCLGVDIKPGQNDGAGRGGGNRPLGQLDRIAEGLLLRPSGSFSPSQALPDRSQSRSRLDKTDRKDISMSCVEEREAALNYHSQEPNAKHFIPACTSTGLWEKAQCHRARGYCWCVKENTGLPIPGTATYKITPNCSFENDREMKGCPFEQKRRFLVDLIGDLTEERRNAFKNQSYPGPEGNLSLRETVARWKLKTLDTNSNGVLERKEWRPMRKTTLKKKTYPRKCRRNFVRYCDEDDNKRITYEEWKACLGLNDFVGLSPENNFNSLPLNPERRGKNPFVDQLT